jgi:regulator of RNase E activity RraA
MGTQGVDELIPLVTSASVCDAMARRHAHVCHVVGLRSARVGQVSYGPAATVRFAPRRDDLPDHDLAAAAGHALSAVPPGAVLVIAAPDAPGEAVAGEEARLDAGDAAQAVAEGHRSRAQRALHQHGAGATQAVHLQM